MDELSGTEKIILSYIESHAPEDCMLDRITMGTNKSRATVLKYLETLRVKGLLEFRMIGRNKLWSVAKATKGAFQVPKASVSGASGDTKKISSAVAELHALKLREEELIGSIDRPDTIVFSISRSTRIVSSGPSFTSIFPGARDLISIIHPRHAPALENALASIGPGVNASIELDLMEKPGIYRPYRLTLSAIVDNAGETAGYSAIGEELSEIKRSKRQLESLIYIIRKAGKARDEGELLKASMEGVKERLLPYAQGAVFLGDASGLKAAYVTPGMDEDSLLSGDIAGLIKSCMGMMETTSNGSGMLAIPVIEDETAAGAILLIVDKAVSTADVENVEIIADEIAGGLRMLRLGRERSEYIHTLEALNRVSGIINRSEDEPAMLERSIASTLDALGFEMGCIYLMDDKDEPVLRSHLNLPESLRSMCVAGKFKDMLMKAFSQNDLVYITPGSHEYASLDPAVRSAGIKTLLILPIKSGNDIIGLLNMGSKEEKPYSAKSLENLGSIGLQLGLALERTRLAVLLSKKATKGLQ